MFKTQKYQLSILYNRTVFGTTEAKHIFIRMLQVQIVFNKQNWKANTGRFTVQTFPSMGRLLWYLDQIS